MTSSQPSSRSVPFLVACLLAVSLQAQGSAQTTHEVNQFSFSFEPRDITIEVGDTVRWIWSGGWHDTVEGTDAFWDPAEDAWGAQLNEGNQVFELVFDEQFLFENPRDDHFYPYVCTPHLIFGMTGTITVVSPWTNLGSGLAGAAGEPLFWGEGPLSAGSANTLHVQDANPSSPAALFAGFVQGAATFKGGTLVPVPWILQLGLATSGTGTITLPFLMPPGLMGIDLYMQIAVQDAGAPVGVALSNALEATGT